MSNAHQIANQLKSQRWPLDYDRVRSMVSVDMAGWYAMWVGGECVYVGVSDDNVRGRLLAHLNRSHNDDLDELIEDYQHLMTFGAVIADYDENVWDIEDDLIGLLKPTTNIQLND